MDYQKHYDTLIQRARARRIIGLTESHHVRPRCMGGSNIAENIVELTPEEHFVAHQLLVKIYPKHKGLIKAAAMMSATRRSSRYYGWLRRKYSESLTGIPRTPEARANMSKAALTSVKAKAALEKLHIAKKGVPKSEEARRKMSAGHMGKIISTEARANMSAALLGRKFSAEWRAKLSATC